MKIEPLPIILLLLFFPIFTTEIITKDYQEPILESPQITILIDNKTLADTIIDINDEFSYELYNLADNIIRCESGWDYTAKNPDSTAYGAGQFLDGTWKYVQNKWMIKLDRYSPEDQLYAMVRLLKEESWVHWSESKSCWNKDNEY